VARFYNVSQGLLDDNGDDDDGYDDDDDLFEELTNHHNSLLSLINYTWTLSLPSGGHFDNQHLLPSESFSKGCMTHLCTNLAMVAFIHF
jgi:hypothetical protein